MVWGIKDKMQIDIEKVYQMIKESKYLENDDRHSEGFRSGVKTAHLNLKSQLSQYEEKHKGIKK